MEVRRQSNLCFTQELERNLQGVKEAHTCIVVSRTEDDSSKINQLRIDDVACHVMPGDYEICVHVTD